MDPVLDFEKSYVVFERSKGIWRQPSAAPNKFFHSDVAPFEQEKIAAKLTRSSLLGSSRRPLVSRPVTTLNMKKLNGRDTRKRYIGSQQDK
jgi:hypothetical protein